jgi:predicted phage terminase large subunit-like protein
MAQLIRRLAKRLLSPEPAPVLNSETVTQGMFPFRQWSRHFLSKHFPLAPSRLHTELSLQLESLHSRRGTLINQVAPRGSAKTTWSTFAYPLYCALEGIEPFIVLGADTGGQADDYVEAIHDELESNERLRAAYWSTIRRMAYRRGRIKFGNGVRIDSASTGKRIRGRKHRGIRPSLVIGDDLQNIDHIVSPLMRQRSMAWLMKDVMEAGTPDTNVIILGTALHRECIVCELQKNPGWDSKLYQAIEKFPDRMDLWENQWKAILFSDAPDRVAQARAFYDANRAEMDAGAVVLWEAREPLYVLMLKRAINGVAAFNSEKQNDPTDPSLCEWPPDYFSWPGIMFDEWPMDSLVNKVIALDPSKGKESRDASINRLGDYSAIVMDGIDKQGRQFIEADLARRSTEAMLADLCKHIAWFKPEQVVIETNQYQELLQPVLSSIAKALGLSLPEIVPCENTVNKMIRIRRLGPDLAQRSMRFKRNSPGTTLLLQQAQDFPHGAHDDGPDALEMARRRFKGDKAWFDML